MPPRDTPPPKPELPTHTLPHPHLSRGLNAVAVKLCCEAVNVLAAEQCGADTHAPVAHWWLHHTQGDLLCCCQPVGAILDDVESLVCGEGGTDRGGGGGEFEEGRSREGTEGGGVEGALRGSKGVRVKEEQRKGWRGGRAAEACTCATAILAVWSAACIEGSYVQNWGPPHEQGGVPS